MSFAKNTVAMAVFAGIIGLAIPATAFAQVGGGTELPSSAEKNKTKDSTEKAQDNSSMKKDDSMKKKSDDKM